MKIINDREELITALSSKKPDVILYSAEMHWGVIQFRNEGNGKGWCDPISWDSITKEPIKEALRPLSHDFVKTYDNIEQALEHLDHYEQPSLKTMLLAQEKLGMTPGVSYQERNKEAFKALTADFADRERRNLGERMIQALGLNYTTPSAGHFKIIPANPDVREIMFYPKSGKVVFKEAIKGRVRQGPVFQAEDPSVLAAKLTSLVEGDKGRTMSTAEYAKFRFDLTAKKLEKKNERGMNR